MTPRIAMGLFLAGAAALAVGPRAPAQGPKSETTPPLASAAPRTRGELVRLALESEVAGNDHRRDALLREALYARPEGASVHWQLGEVWVQGRWHSAREVELSASADKRLAEYSRRRDAAGASAADHAALARWCRKNRLDEQQRAEWCAALRADPADVEAISGLRLRPFLGTLMTPHQIEQAKAEMRAVATAADSWGGEVVRWRDGAERGNAGLPANVRAMVADAADGPEFVGLERTLWQQVGGKRRQRAYRTMLLALMPALGENPSPPAAASLARYSVFCTMDDVRAAAVAGLKRHPLDHYAMLLLGALQSPVEARAWVDGAAAYYTVFQEGALADLRLSNTVAVSASVVLNNGLVVTTESAAAPQTGNRFDPVDVARQTAAAGLLAQREAALRELNRDASAFLDSVDLANAVIRQRNERITFALRQLTGVEAGPAPMSWWKWWWEDYNEMYSVPSAGDPETAERPAKPVRDYQTFGEWVYVSMAPCSCFAPGTKVWTMTGRRPIEGIKIGDCVLAQDVESGELAYKPVLGVTIRPAPPTMKMRAGAESFNTTPSHPFWVPGRGWRMTKQLEAGARLHSLSGGVPVEQIETLAAESLEAPVAYNLIVADFSTYFVGERGLLVHDNTPRKSTAALLPGLPPARPGNGERQAGR